MEWMGMQRYGKVNEADASALWALWGRRRCRTTRELGSAASSSVSRLMVTVNMFSCVQYSVQSVDTGYRVVVRSIIRD